MTISTVLQSQNYLKVIIKHIEIKYSLVVVYTSKIRIFINILTKTLNFVCRKLSKFKKMLRLIENWSLF
jgi:hypothetical protein